MNYVSLITTMREKSAIIHWWNVVMLVVNVALTACQYDESQHHREHMMKIEECYKKISTSQGRGTLQHR